MKKIIMILVIFIGLSSIVFALETSWMTIATINGGPCGCFYPECDKADYGLYWLQEGDCVSSADYDFL